MYEGSLSDERSVQLVGQVVRLLWKSPSLGESFYSLSTGSQDTNVRPTNDMDKVDLPRIRAILTSNAFGQNSEAENVVHKKWKAMNGESMMANILEQKEGSGVWNKESMFNHSCTPNCSWSQIGDQMFVKAIKDIKKDEELRISYVSREHTTYEERKKMFQNWTKRNVGFVCACDHCDLLRKHGDLCRLSGEVDKAYATAAKSVTLISLSMAAAAESVIPTQRRAFIKKQFSKLPLCLQPLSMAKLHVLECSVLASQRGHCGSFDLLSARC